MVVVKRLGVAMVWWGPRVATRSGGFRDAQMDRMEKFQVVLGDNGRRGMGVLHGVFLGVYCVCLWLLVCAFARIL